MCRASCARREKKNIPGRSLVIWSMVTMPDFGFDGVSSSLAEFSHVSFLGGGGRNKVYLVGIWPKQGAG